VSKAFTREDEGASFESPARPERLSEARLTAYGARLARERLAELEQSGASTDGALAVDRLRQLVDTADVVEPAGADRVALGARVRIRSEHGGKERVVVLVTPDEVGLVPFAISVASPIAQALVGARAGETVELELPRGAEELTVLAVEWPH